MAESYGVGLQGLSPGQHQWLFTSRFDANGPYTGRGSAQDISYNISAVPEASTLARMSLGLLVLSAGELRRRLGAKG